MQKVSENPTLVHNSTLILTELPGILETYQELHQKQKGLKQNIAKTMNADAQTLMFHRYSFQLSKTTSSEIAAEIFEQTKGKNWHASWVMISRITRSEHGQSNRLFLKEAKDLIKTENIGLYSEIPNYKIVFQKAMDNFTFGELADQVRNFLLATIIKNLQSKEGTPKNKVAISCINLLHRLSNLTPGHAKVLGTLFNVHRAPYSLHNKLAIAINQLAVNHEAFFLETMELIDNDNISEELKVTLLNPTRQHYFLVNELKKGKISKARKKELHLLAKRKAYILDHLIKSTDVSLQLAALEHAFNLVVVYGIRHKSLLANIEQKLLQRETRRRTAQLYAAAISVDKSLNNALVAPVHSSILQPYKGMSLCFQTFARSLRSKSKLASDWHIARANILR